MPISVTQGSGDRLVAPQGTVLTGTRISTVSAPQQQSMIGSTARLVTTAPSSVTLGRLSVSVATSPAQASNPSVLGQTRISTLYPLVAVANSTQPRTLQTQGAKVIAQPVQGN